MTQKELAYMEDAIGHEDNIMKILEESLKMMEDNELISFLNDEAIKHQDRKEKLLNLLKEKANG